MLCRLCPELKSRGSSKLELVARNLFYKESSSPLVAVLLLVMMGSGNGQARAGHQPDQPDQVKRDSRVKEIFFKDPSGHKF